ncbi:basic secretory protein-like protein [Olivibacter sitiensis]|uniref:basic secretory protein-like protein n=1 Tax=Olivibacter sitiensis TaxID=376470 RepID=UPI0004114ACF|nr:basic secretory protein-like protein [Olivibacter sitiensis]
MLRKTLLAVVIIAVIAVQEGKAQRKSWNDMDLTGAIVDTLKKGKYTLIFIDKSPDFNPELKQRLIETFFEVYPKEAKKYNPKTTRQVTFFVDPAYDGVAAAGGGLVRFNPQWFKKSPNDIDVVTHEVMHLVQSYPRGAGPGWITEGIADYVRYTMGVDNEGAGWSLTPFNEKQSYENAYRITARFFYWMEQQGQKNLVKKLDHAMRSKTYTDAFWKDETGKTVDEWWAQYAQNPVLK